MLRTALSPPMFEPIREVWQRGGALETMLLRELAERQARADFGAFFDFWVYSAELPEYRLRKVELKTAGDAFTVRLQVENLGTGAYPVPAVVQTEEGARHEFSVLAAPAAKAEVELTVVTKPAYASIDPEADVLMASGARAWLPVRRKFWIF
jgi:hypothetical protein